MEPESIDWNSVESVFVLDDTYESFDAPHWLDLSASDEPIDLESWFCNPDCKHPKNIEDFRKTTHYSKVKLVRSVSISEIFPFRDRNRRDVKLKEKEKSSSSTAKFPNPKNSNEDSENKNPNVSAPIPYGRTKPRRASTKPSTEKKKQRDDSSENSWKHEHKPQLRSTFSARNLLGRREILNQITDFCSEIKKLGRTSWKKGATEKEHVVLGELKERVRDRERMPLLVIKEGERET